MKIAVIGIKKIPSDREQTERHCQELYTRIAARGHKIDIFALVSSPKSFWFSVRFYKNIRVITLFPALRKLWFVFSLALNTVWATFGHYDVIHINGVENAWFAWFIKLFSLSKVVLTCRQLEYRQRRHTVINFLWRWLEKRIVRRADEIIVDSKALETYFQEQHQINVNYIPNAPKLYNPSESDTFSYNKILNLESQRYILCLGKLEPEYKPDLLAKAFQKLQPENWQLVFVGDIGNCPEYASQVIAQAQQNNIIFVSNDRGYFLTELISNAGLLIVPAEGANLKSPLGMLEAMQLGIPVIASDIAIHREIIGSDRGILFASGELESLSSQLQFALSEPDLTKIIKNAQTHVAIYHNWDRVVYKNLFLYLKSSLAIASQSPECRTIDN